MVSLAFFAAPLHAGASRDCVAADTDLITLNVDEVFNGTEGAVAIWVSMDAMSANGRFVFFRADNGNLIHIRWTNASDVVTWTYTANSTNETHTHSTTEDGVWHHYGMSWSDSGEITRYYVDGAEVGTDTTLGTWAGTLVNQALCQNSLSATEILDGRVAYFELWNRAITGAEFAQSHRCPGSVVKGLVSYLPLWEPGDTYQDLSATGQDGTNTGTTESFSGPPVSLCGSNT
jgi:hypothetical protein